MPNPLDELIAASLDMIEKVLEHIRQDWRVRPGKQHDLFDVLNQLQRAVMEFEQPDSDQSTKEG